MDLEAAKTLQIGAWCADPLRSTLTRGNEIVRVEARSMRLLLSLAAHAGQTMSVEKLLDEVWEGVVVSPDSVYQAVASLRRLLGDDPKNPTYIATAPRLGYRMVAEVSVAPGAAPEPAPPLVVLPPGASPSPPRIRRQMPSKGVLRLLISLVPLVALVGLGVVIHEHGSGRAAQPQSVAVLPFIDLTSQAMDEEYFADGITEELRDQLSHVAGLRVPAATSSLSGKGKKLSATDVAAPSGPSDRSRAQHWLCPSTRLTPPLSSAGLIMASRTRLPGSSYSAVLYSGTELTSLDLPWKWLFPSKVCARATMRSTGAFAAATFSMAPSIPRLHSKARRSFRKRGRTSSPFLAN
jgi:transcriptional activator of cad operon